MLAPTGHLFGSAPFQCQDRCAKNVQLANVLVRLDTWRRVCLPKLENQVLESEWTGDGQINRIAANDSQERNIAGVVKLCMSTSVLKGPLKGQWSG